MKEFFFIIPIFEEGKKKKKKKKNTHTHTIRKDKGEGEMMENISTLISFDSEK